MNEALEQAGKVKVAVVALNEAARTALSGGDLSVIDARTITAICRETEDWLAGVRKLLEVG